MKKYFNYELKKNLYVIGVLALVMVILHVAPILISYPQQLRNNERHIALLSVYAGIIAVIVPIWLMDYKMKKRSVDLYYAVPLSHTKVLAAKFLLGLIAVFVPYTLAYWLGALSMIAKIGYYIHAVWYVPFYFASLIPIYIIYSISAFVYTRANKGIDGFMFLLFWCFAFASIVEALQELFNAANFYMEYFLPFEPLNLATTFFQCKIYDKSISLNWNTARIVSISIGFAISALMSVGATIGLLFTEKNAKAENVGQISDSWFGYKLMLPLYAVTLTSLCAMDSYSSPFIIIMIATAVFFASVLYKRSIKIGKKQAMVLVGSFLVGFALCLINTYVKLK